MCARAICLISLLLTACTTAVAEDDAVKDKATAISIAAKICAAQFPVSANERHHWSARLNDESWFVCDVGDHPGNRNCEGEAISINKHDGKPSKCSIVVTTHDR